MKFLVASACFIFIWATGFTQTIDDLRRQKQLAENEIETTTHLLEEIQTSEKASVNRLNLINNHIQQRDTLISALSNEIRVWEEVIENDSVVIGLLQADLENIKNEYAALLRLAYRNKNLIDPLVYVFTAEDFNQAYRRYQFFRQLTSYRQKQAQVLQAVQTELQSRTAKLEKQKAEKMNLIRELEEESMKLEEEKIRKDKEISDLRAKQRELRHRLYEQKNVEEQLENEITMLMDSTTSGNTKAGGTFAFTPEQKLVGESFVLNRKRLPWPVERGVITEHFGIHRHPVLTNVEINNNGVNIATEPGAKVRSVFNGEVSRVFGIKGGNMTVIIRHGNYLSVYSNLREVFVKKGDIVAVKQEIGTVFTDNDNKSVLKFQIWHENEKQDPEEWISK